MSKVNLTEWVNKRQKTNTRDFHVALRFRKRGDRTGEEDEFIGYDRTFTEGDARKEQQRILLSPSYRAEVPGSLGVVVMHWRTWKRQIKDGKACTMNRIEQNMRMYGTELNSASNLVKRLDHVGHLVGGK